MTAHNIDVTPVTIRETGHGRGKMRSEPRNNTVCFTVTESEQRAIDALSMCSSLRRSAILTEIVTRFMAAAAESARSHSKRDALVQFLDECQESIRTKQELFRGMSEKGD